MLLSVSRGLVNGMESMFAQRDTETVSIRGGYAQKAFKGLKENRRIRLKDSDMDVLESQNANVIADVAAQISNDSAKVTSSKDYLTEGYRGVYPTEQRNSGLNIVNGRFINQNDINQRRRVAVINEESAKTLFGEKSLSASWSKSAACHSLSSGHTNRNGGAMSTSHTPRHVR